MEQPVHKTVLIVHDEIDLSLVMKAYCLRKGYHVRISHTLCDATFAIRQEAPDFVLLDPNVCQNVKEARRMIQEAAPDAQILILGLDNLKHYL